MLLYCEWKSKPVNCSDIFQLVPSNQGFCCVYNLQTVHLNRKRYKHIYTKVFSVQRIVNSTVRSPEENRNIFIFIREYVKINFIWE